MASPVSNGVDAHVRFIPLTYDSQDSHQSALKLILTLVPEWGSDDSNIDFVRFTDGITNTLLKAVNRRPGMSKLDVDREAILLRAYGSGTAILIDREREAENHELLMKYNLAPELLARFKNGMMYRYICGTPAHHQDLSDPLILTAIARRMAQWHATVPCLPDHHKTAYSNGASAAGVSNGTSGAENGEDHKSRQQMIDNAAPGKPPPNVWTTMQKWILALPTDTEAQRERQALLQRELVGLIEKLSQRPGLGRNGVCRAEISRKIPPCKPPSLIGENVARLRPL